MPTCMRCKQDLPQSRFGLSKKRHRYYKAYCLDCCRIFSDEAKAHAADRRKNKKSGTSYKSRNDWLARMGFGSYRDYLNSDLWRDIRRKVFAAKGSRCRICRKKATELHHHRYHGNDLAGIKTKFIHPVCRACHISIEFDGGKKRDMRKARQAFRNMLKQSRN